jgi:hypothetical protein
MELIVDEPASVTLFDDVCSCRPMEVPNASRPSLSMCPKTLHIQQYTPPLGIPFAPFIN